MPFFIIFIIIPFLEIMAFMTVGEQIGLLNTLILALLTAILGGFLVRNQGLKTILALRESMQAGRVPLDELFDGICLIIAGATLITPGFVTDTIGFLLLMPFVRSAIKNYIRKNTNWHTEVQNTHFHSDPNAIEAEYSRVDDEES